MDYKKWLDLYEKYEYSELTYDTITNIYKDFQLLSEEFYSGLTKDELVEDLLNFYTEARSIPEETADDYMCEFLISLFGYSDRMNTGRLLKLKILIENAKGVS